jgi:thermitase
MRHPIRLLTVASFALAVLGTSSISTASARASVHVMGTGAGKPAPALKSLQWYLKDARVYGAWTIATTRGAGVRICSVDTGAATIPDLAPAIVSGANLVDVTKPTSWTDDEGHGTFTASEMVARGTVLDGVAPDASLIVAKVLNQNGSGGSNNVNGGILYCVAQGARVINVSLGGSGSNSDGIAMAIRYACAHGVALAVAAGNEAAAHTGDHPASINSPCLIAVNAADSKDKLASFSNWDQNQRELTAGGVNVVGESPSGPEIDSGTSMSSPLVAGTLALEMGEGVDATTAVRDLLASARQPAAAKSLGSHWHTFYGAGMLDATAAVQKAARDAPAG